MTDDVEKLKEEILTLRKDRDAWADLASRQSKQANRMLAEILELRKLHAIIDKLHRQAFGGPALPNAGRSGEDWEWPIDVRPNGDIRP
jgi:hypothetical protein